MNTMASGGARARSGPPPDPTALRRDRPSDAAEWITLPAERTGPAPEWPLPEQTDREAALWERQWTRPQATEWERLDLVDEVALYVRVWAEAELSGATGKSRDLVRMYRENLGLSMPGLSRLKWRIAGAPAAAPAGATKAAPSKSPRRPSARDRFQVVPPQDDDPPPF